MTPEERLASLAKPPGSLGLLETWATCMCKAQQTLKPRADPARVLVFCGDHGAKKADESLSPFPPSVTNSVFRALAAGISGTAVISRSVGAGVTVIDVGIDGDVSDVTSGDANVAVRHSKVARGTADFRHNPALTSDTLDAALRTGRDVVAAEATQRGVLVVAIGEVGIGNTTSAAALLAALTGSDASECCGRGTGLDDAGLKHKVAVVEAACEHHAAAIAAAGVEADAASASEAATAACAKAALSHLGSLEIAAMVGAYTEAARRGMIAIVDGFISAVAALCAVRIEPPCRQAMVFATALAEEPSASKGDVRFDQMPYSALMNVLYVCLVGFLTSAPRHVHAIGGAILEEALDAHPALAMGLRLGEGSGAALALPLLRAAAQMVAQMGTLEEALALGASRE